MLKESTPLPMTEKFGLQLNQIKTIIAAEILSQPQDIGKTLDSLADALAQDFHSSMKTQIATQNLEDMFSMESSTKLMSEPRLTQPTLTLTFISMEFVTRAAKKPLFGKKILFTKKTVL